VGISFRNSLQTEEVSTVTFAGRPMTEVISSSNGDNGYVYIYSL